MMFSIGGIPPAHRGYLASTILTLSSTPVPCHNSSHVCELGFVGRPDAAVMVLRLLYLVTVQVFAWLR
jgi:hypothetical protein